MKIKYFSQNQLRRKIMDALVLTGRFENAGLVLRKNLADQFFLGALNPDDPSEIIIRYNPRELTDIARNFGVSLQVQMFDPKTNTLIPAPRPLI
jgi:hypothetical protein